MSKSCITFFIAAVLVLPILNNINTAYAQIQGPGSGLLAHWRFDEGTGAVAADSSGTGNAGTLVNGASWTTGRIGSGALRLQRALSQKVTVNDSPSLSVASQSFTITAWANLSSAFSYSAIVSKSAGGTGYTLALLNSKAIFQVSNAGQEALVHADQFGPMPLNTWVHVAAWYDSVARTVNVSVNNGPIDSRPYSAGTADTPAPLSIGQLASSAAYWDGFIDDVRVYGRVLSVAELTEIYTLPPGGTTPPPPDATPPVISNIQVANVGQSTATITWTTNEPADGQVEFLGACPSAGCFTALVTPVSTAHTISISTLAPATVYSYRIRSRDAASNLAVSATNSFTTLPVSTESFTETVYAGPMDTITAMAFAPDGRLFIATQNGQLRVVKNGALLAAPFLSVPVFFSGENGLLGVTFDPNFASNRYVYVYYTNASPKAHRLSRFRASVINPDVVEAGSETIIFSGAATGADYHNGGAIHFGNDGKLYVAVGDNSDRTNAQSLSAVNGKILRLNPDGTIPADNPFMSTPGARREIWAYGLRNPFTFAFDPTSGAMRINDVGDRSFEEINAGTAGANYGWPTCEGPCSNAGLVSPLYAYGTPANKAITGAAFYRGSQFPASYQGVYFFGDCVNNFIKYLDRNNQVVSWRTAESPVDLKVGPDGSLYYAGLLTGTVYKISYQSTGANRAPTALMSASPVSGRAPLTVTFGAAASSDPDGDILSYSWRFGDGTTGSGVTVAKTYASAGSYLAELTVSDGRGGSAIATQLISAGNPPVPTITAPVAGTLYTAGDTILYSGSATDTEDGVLAASAFSWTIVFHHGNHTHPFIGPIGGVRNGSITIPTVGETATDVWYRVSLTVTDSSGLTQTVYTDVIPRTANITLNANVAGIALDFDSQSKTLPYSTLSVAGIVRYVGAPSPQTVAGRVYDFVSWSDGGTQDHAISSPVNATTYTATYRERTTTPPPSTFLAHWRFDEGTGVTASDSSGSGNPGTLVNGASWTAGAVGNTALRLDRAMGQRIVVNDSASLSLGNQDFTITAWAYISSEFGTSAIVSKDNGTIGYSLLIMDGMAAFQVKNTGETSLVQASLFGPIPLYTWVHVAAWYDSTAKTIRISVNNGQTQSRSCMNGTADTTAALTIGQYGPGNFWDGYIDDVRIYGRLLSASELTDLYNLGPAGN